MNKENMENSAELPKEQANQETVLKEKATNVEPPVQEEKAKVEDIEKPKPSAEEIKETKPKPAKVEPDYFNSQRNGPLAGHFDRFRKAKKQDIKYRNYVSSQALKHRTDPEFKQRLRERFVETAKKYFGVPYGSRYWKEGEKYHNAPLYLDCCALVRQIVYDLREDFGFQLERWNQAY